VADSRRLNLPQLVADFEYSQSKQRKKTSSSIGFWAKNRLFEKTRFEDQQIGAQQPIFPTPLFLGVQI